MSYCVNHHVGDVLIHMSYFPTLATDQQRFVVVAVFNRLRYKTRNFHVSFTLDNTSGDLNDPPLLASVYIWRVRGRKITAGNKSLTTVTKYGLE